MGVGESIQYLANERSSDPKVVGIISNGYPHRSLGELKLDNKYQAYYATKWRCGATCSLTGTSQI